VLLRLVGCGAHAGARPRFRGLLAAARADRFAQIAGVDVAALGGEKALALGGTAALARILLRTAAKPDARHVQPSSLAAAVGAIRM
jgi:hypothetical protein